MSSTHNDQRESFSLFLSLSACFVFQSVYRLRLSESKWNNNNDDESSALWLLLVGTVAVSVVVVASRALTCDF